MKRLKYTYSEMHLSAVIGEKGSLFGLGERDPAPLFFNPDVQQLLKKLTRLDLTKVYRTRHSGKNLKPPQYKFLTTEELDELMKDAEIQAEKKLQMPPVVKQRIENDENLSCDYELQGLTNDKIVFTDITYGISDKERVIVVRDPNGVLRKANSEERHRMNETYFPLPGRKIRIPHMFEKQYLQRLLDHTKYEFVLDRACLQFEPDDPMYQNVTTTVYETVDTNQHYNKLRSTRHFGPFAFHLAWSHDYLRINPYAAKLKWLDEAVALVTLYHKLNPDAKSANTKCQEGQEHEFIQTYIKQDSKKRAALELSLQANVELHKQREMVEANIRKAHGQVS
ncbi:hypothetical protein C0J52_06423 [Blattella germanica]|nr:hypothetical protein C0J52_06423 [Blattella germanica]